MLRCSEILDLVVATNRDRCFFLMCRDAARLYGVAAWAPCRLRRWPSVRSASANVHRRRIVGRVARNFRDTILMRKHRWVEDSSFT